MQTTMIKINRENINVTDSFFPNKRENVLARIMENLVQSGILMPGETNIYRDHFSRYDWDELLQILDESNRQRATCDPIIVHA